MIDDLADGGTSYLYLCEGEELEGMYFVDDMVSFEEARERLAISLQKQGVENFKMRRCDEEYEDWRN